MTAALGRRASAGGDGSAQHGVKAIMLAVKSSRGETIVYHYPPSVSSADDQAHDRPQHETGKRKSSDYGESHGAALHRDGTASRSNSEDKHSGSTVDGGQQGAPWSSILGLDARVLADVFTPRRSDSKFELWIDDVTFVGNPVHRRSDGTWIKKKVKKHGRPADGSVSDGATAASPQLTGSDSPPAVMSPVAELPSSMSNVATGPQRTSAASQTGNAEDESSPMTMFHLVFALDIAFHDRYAERIQAIYDNIVTQLTFALTYEQARCNYVWKEYETIVDLKRQAVAQNTDMSVLWANIAVASDLARVVNRTYDGLSAGSIVHLLINDQINLSLSMPSELTSVLLPRDPDERHIFLTSATSFGSKLNDDTDPLLLPHWALLLLDDVDNVLAELPPGASPLLIKFVKAIKPTLTFGQLSESLSASLHDISTLAKHLVHWQFALPVRPLHVRNIFTTSPTAPVARLKDDADLFAARFPTVPPLPRILHAISQRNAPYSALVPSRDHRNLYIDVLAWLLRRGWLIELRTFVWVKVTPDVKRAVQYERRRRRSSAKSTDLFNDDAHDNDHRRVDSDAAPPTRPVTPTEKPVPRTAITTASSTPRAAGSAILTAAGTDSDSDSEDDEEQLQEETIIPDPYSASARERRQLGYIAAQHTGEIATAFERMVKYFNGQHAIEKVIVRENIPRKTVRKVLDLYDPWLIKMSTW